MHISCPMILRQSCPITVVVASSYPSCYTISILQCTCSAPRCLDSFTRCHFPIFIASPFSFFLFSSCFILLLTYSSANFSNVFIVSPQLTHSILSSLISSQQRWLESCKPKVQRVPNQLLLTGHLRYSH